VILEDGRVESIQSAYPNLHERASVASERIAATSGLAERGQ